MREGVERLPYEDAAVGLLNASAWAALGLVAESLRPVVPPESAELDSLSELASVGPVGQEASRTLRPALGEPVEQMGSALTPLGRSPAGRSLVKLL